MGAWGTGSFSNDDAADWLDMLMNAPEGAGSDEEPGVQALIFGAIGAVVVDESDDAGEDEDDDELDDEDEDDGDEGEEMIDATVASEAVAAAEVIAAVRGHPGSFEDADELRDWIKSGLKPADRTMLLRGEFAAPTIEALNRVLSPESELAELWADSDDEGKAWRANVQDLIKRLQKKS